jgi:rare lipoprotein A (peptidoglycan hydrolase)
MAYNFIKWYVPLPGVYVAKESSQIRSVVLRGLRLLTAIGLLTVINTPQPAGAGNAYASYYSSHYNGKKMANGQTFSQGGYTAAHPSYRLGTRVKVYNPKNKRSVIVTVTDRCRCSLDLSKAAFSRIANLSQGRVPVQTTKL